MARELGALSPRSEPELLREDAPLEEAGLRPLGAKGPLLGRGRRVRGFADRRARLAFLALAFASGAALLALAAGRALGGARAGGGSPGSSIVDVAVRSGSHHGGEAGHHKRHTEAAHHSAHHRKARHHKEKKVECAEKNKDCTVSHCCKTPGLQCFAKDSNRSWAVCREVCTPGPDVQDIDSTPWTCQALGKRTPGKAPAPEHENLWMADWAKANCSSNTESCEDSRCCKAVGMQCFSKTKGWAACKGECNAGPDPIDVDSKPWECKALGMRSPGKPPTPGGNPAKWVAEKCSKAFENCRESRCCAEAGKQCYKKHEHFSMCLEECTPGPLLWDSDPLPWNCTKQGMRTPGTAQGGVPHRVAGWVKTNCSKAGGDCRKTMCCRDATFQCYEKNSGWAACLRSCSEQGPAGDKSSGKWSCNKFGPRTPRPWNDPSLYCIHVMMVHSYEAGLVKQEMSHNGGVGIFACELFDVFSQDPETELGVGPMGRVRTRHFAPAYVGRSVDGTAGNSALFMNVWDAVRWVGNYRLTEWTIKADPDAVMLPDRLRYHLRGKPPKAYIVNCNKPDLHGAAMMFGSVEAMSRVAMEAYFNSGMTCRKNYQFGEDRWLGDCLNELGVTPVQDFGMVGDGVCTGANCGDGKAAYHPFKDAGAWLNCLNTAIR